ENASNCCFKCGSDLRFVSADVSNYIYSTTTGFKLNSIPFNSNFFKPHNLNYSGQQNLITVGNLDIPDNSIVPANSTIRAAGKITIGSNVTIGNNSVIESEINIETNKNNNFGPNVEFRIVDYNSIKYGCHSPNYQNSHLTDDEIRSFCNSVKYTQRAFSSLVFSDSLNRDKNSEKDNNLLNILVSPNPNTGKFNVSVFNNNDQNYFITLMDVTGKIILNQLYSGQQSSQFVETNGLAAGVYFVKVTCGENQKIEKLIIANN
ncbi:MAG TPA: T9SS type A sorting domain-containing protein, partial [Bacteroidia bacterium]